MRHVSSLMRRVSHPAREREGRASMTTSTVQLLGPAEGEAASREPVSERRAHLVRAARLQALLLALGIPLVLGAWVVAARALELEVVWASRAATLSAIPLLLLAIPAPLYLEASREIRERNYVVLWFVVALFFNVWWEIPQLVFKDAFAAATYDHANLPRFIAWWGYGTSDLDYFRLTDFFVLAEISFWVANVLAVAGLWKVRAGDELLGMILLGVCGALQVYNVFFFIGYGGICEHFRNIATDSPMAPVLYWVMNLMWALAGFVASIYAFRAVRTRVAAAA